MLNNYTYDIKEVNTLSHKKSEVYLRLRLNLSLKVLFLSIQ